MFENVKRVVLLDNTITYFFDSSYILPLEHPLPDPLLRFLLLHVKVLKVDSILPGSISRHFLEMAGQMNCKCLKYCQQLF